MAQLLATLLPLVAMFAIMYFLLILPEKKRTKKYNEMLSALKVNDEVVTRGGIIGKITNIKDDTVTIETSSAKTRIKFDKNGISYKLNTDK